MKKEDIKIGNTYSAKITDKVVPIRIDAEHDSGGWIATNLKTNRQVRIKSAQKLRGEVKTNPAAAKSRQPMKKLTAAERKARNAQLKAQAAADQENARVRDERDASKDGMTASERAMTETAKKSKAKRPKADKAMSLLDAAAKVLADAKTPMNTREMVDAVTEKGLWKPGAGKTPHATLYSAILRETKVKGDEARFAKVERGRFTLTKGA